jgi:hypothetical protein
MARATTAYKRLFCRNLLWKAEQYGDSLIETLKALAQARLTESHRGKVLVSSAANGHSDTWQVPDHFTPMDAADLCSEMLDRYDEAVDALGDDSTDAEIHTEMLEKIGTAPKSIKNDYSMLRSGRELT